MADPINNTTIDLKQFCAAEGKGFHLDNPFSRASYTWATDGNIMLRVPLRADVGEVEGAPHAERVWSDATGPFTPVRPFNLPDPQRVRCDGCEGRCTAHDCPDCGCMCEKCDGAGFVEEAAVVSIGEGRTMSRQYAEAIMTLPCLEVELIDPSSERLHFRFDGGDGIVMLMRPGYRRAIIADLLKGATCDA